jgi:hypothetical protein
VRKYDRLLWCDPCLYWHVAGGYGGLYLQWRRPLGPGSLSESSVVPSQEPERLLEQLMLEARLTPVAMTELPPARVSFRCLRERKCSAHAGACGGRWEGGYHPFSDSEGKGK